MPEPFFMSSSSSDYHYDYEDLIHDSKYRKTRVKEPRSGRKDLTSGSLGSGFRVFGVFRV